LRRFFEEDGHDVIASGAGRRPPRSATGDVYHAHHFGVAAYYLTMSGARPLIYTSHNPFLVSPFEVAESKLETRLQRHVLRSADAIVALSEAEAHLLSRRFGVPRGRFVVIPNGLNLSHYQARDRSPGDSTKLLAVGQLVDYKGHPYLFQALAQVVGEGHDVSLTVVSHRDDRKAEYLAQCRSLGIADRVRFEGPFSTSELVERYRDCDLFVQPSLAECFHITILEAMACGAPVIATDVGGVAEEVGDAGLVVQAQDADSLARAIARLCGAPDERIAMSRCARLRVEELYDGRDVAARHLALYRELCARPRRRSAGNPTSAALLLGLYSRRGRVARLVPTRVRRLGAPS
jgi:glycosyltransferase involved in cell wall biosynthesis